MVTFLPFNLEVKVPSGTLILDAARQANLSLQASCGGKGTCGNCVVQIISKTSYLKPSAGLPKGLTSSGYTLACQTEIHEDLRVNIPRFEEYTLKTLVKSEYFETQKEKISGIFEVSPPVVKLDLQLSPPSLEDNYSDLKRLEQELQKKTGWSRIHCEYSVLKKLARTAREDKGKISLLILDVQEGRSIIDVKPQHPNDRFFGISCDLGTTTVVVYLVDLQDGTILHTVSSYNHQIKGGEDIISRINYAHSVDRLQELQFLGLETINHLIEKAAGSVGIDTSQVYFGTVTGNTTMIHLLLKLDPRYIRTEPYVPTINEVPMILSRDIGLSMHPEARVFFAPAVGSYVGGDITAGLLCTPVPKESERISLYVDAGTNGELVLGSQEWLITCACSAGPAFEGRGIRCGMPAVEGAIEKLKITDSGEVKYKVIDDIKPKGVCGSGLVDILAELFIHGYIDRYGKFNLEKARERVIETESGNGFIIEKSPNCFWGKDLVITEKDISHLIRTKGALFSACSLLLKKVGLSFEDIDAFYLAGGFGQSLDVENSIRIGLLPDLERIRFHYIGNSSLQGAYLLLLNQRNWDLVADIANKATYMELNTEPDYMNEYTGALFLPHTEISLFPSVKQWLES